MKQLGDLFASLWSGDPTPSAPPTRLITATTPPGAFGSGSGVLNLTKGAIMSKMSKETLRSIIDQVDADPLAGMGTFSKRDILIDRLLAHWNTVEIRPADQPTQPKPILTEQAAAQNVTATATLRTQGQGTARMSAVARPVAAPKDPSPAEAS